MSQPHKDDQHQADQMENTSHPKRLVLGFDPAILAVLLLFVMLLFTVLPDIWPLILGAVGVGLTIRAVIHWHDWLRGRKP